MNVKSLSWLGIRTAHAAAMSVFYRDVLKLNVLQEESDGARYALADGAEIHVYDEVDTFHEFFGTAPVVGFSVDSFAETQQRMVQAGIEFLYPEPQRQAGKIWQHFRAPDSNVYEIIGEDDLEKT